MVVFTPLLTVLVTEPEEFSVSSSNVWVEDHFAVAADPDTVVLIVRVSAPYKLGAPLVREMLPDNGVSPAELS